MTARPFDLYPLIAVVTGLALVAAIATLIRRSSTYPRRGLAFGWLSLLTGLTLLLLLVVENEVVPAHDAFGFAIRLPPLIALGLHLVALVAALIGMERIIRAREGRAVSQVQPGDEARVELKPALSAARPLVGSALLRHELLPPLRLAGGFALLVLAFAVVHFVNDSPYLKGIMTLVWSASLMGIGGLAISIWAAVRTCRQTDTLYADPWPRAVLTFVLMVASCTVAAVVVLLAVLLMMGFSD